MNTNKIVIRFLNTKKIQIIANMFIRYFLILLFAFSGFIKRKLLTTSLRICGNWDIVASLIMKYYISK